MRESDQAALSPRAVIVWIAALVTLALVAIFAFGFFRPWKPIQQSLREIERSEIERAQAARVAAAGEERERLMAALAAEDARLLPREGTLHTLGTELRSFEHKLRRAEDRWRRAEVDDDPTASREARIAVEEWRQLIAERRERIAELDGERQRLRHELAALEHTSRAEPCCPGGLRIEEVASPGFLEPAAVGAAGLPDAVARPVVDRCVTCHLGTSRAPDTALGALTGPLGGHPRAELFAAPDSVHPYASFGCTVCHGGVGRATDFAGAGHRSRNVSGQASWEAPAAWLGARGPGLILDGTMAAAGCAQCHRRPVAGGESLAAGRRLSARLACASCHRLSAPGLPPSRLASSLAVLPARRDRGWVTAFLRQPAELDATTAMPDVFAALGSASAAPEEAALEEAEVSAIVDSLWRRAPRVEPLPTAPAGDADSGARLFASLGCDACHRPPGSPAPAGLDGGDLRTASELSASWIYAYLRDPGATLPGARMPDFRLEAGAAADLTAFLRRRIASATTAPLAGEDFAVTAASRDRALLAYLEEEMAVEDAQRRLAEMSAPERWTILGERAIAHRACAICHQIPGIEAAPPASDPVDGPRLLARLHDDGGLDLAGWPHRGQSTPPRPARAHRLVAPDYGLQAPEARALWIALAAPVGTTAQPERWADAGLSAAARRGGELLDELGCASCHGASFGPPGSEQAVPSFEGVGARLRSRWIFDYLDDPGAVTVRPWLDVRMPTYDLDDAARNDLVAYFAEAAGVPLFVAAAPPASPRQLALGAVAFEVLRCDGCHPGGDGSRAVPVPAPRYDLAVGRLRPDWVTRLLLHPMMIDAVPMPDLLSPTRPDSATFLERALVAPMYRGERQRLLPFYEDDRELQADLADPERVAAALRAHLLRR